MNNFSLKLKILFGVETILSARILLFTIPVIIAKKSEVASFPFSVDDWMVLVFTYISGLYLFVGIASLLGIRFWKLLHYLIAVVALFLNSFLLKFIQNRGGDAELIHYAPIAFVLFVSICVAFAKTTREKTNNWKSILVVDDDEMLLKTIRPILMKAGYSVLTAMNGEAGFEIAKKQQPSLIILDVILPGIKGRDLCKKIKTDPATKNIPVVFLTAKYSEDDIKAELEAGASAHLTKPIDQKSLLTTVNSLLVSGKK